MTMKGFRFRLQKVLEHRERLEKESAVRLAEARNEAEAALRAVESLEAARRAGAERAGRVSLDGVTAGELQRLALLVQQLDQHLVAASEAMDDADRHVDAMTTEFEDALTQRRVLDRLREKHLLLWRSEEEQRDRAVMDAIALTRHTRRQEDA